MSNERQEGFDWLPAPSANSVTAMLGAAGYFVDGNPSLLTVAGRFGGNALTPNTANPWAINCPTLADRDEGYIGVALKVPAANAAPIAVRFRDLTTPADKITVSLHPNGVIKVWRGSINTTLLAASRPGAYYNDSWFYLEAGALIAASGGWVTVRVNTVSVISLVSANTGSGDFNGWSIGAPAGGNPDIFVVDDVYFNNAEGGSLDGFLGQVRCQSSLPSGAGDLTEWTPFGAATNWQAASNKAIDDTKYVSTPNVGDQDLYDVAPLVNAPVIYSVQVRGFYRQTDATERFVKNLIKSGSTLTEGTEAPCYQAFAANYDVYELNPDTGDPWDYTEVNALQIGPSTTA